MQKNEEWKLEASGEREWREGGDEDGGGEEKGMKFYDAPEWPFPSPSFSLSLFLFFLFSFTRLPFSGPLLLLLLFLFQRGRCVICCFAAVRKGTKEGLLLEGPR